MCITIESKNYIVKGDENENTGQYSQSGVLLINNLNLTNKSQTGPELHSNSDFRMLFGENIRNFTLKKPNKLNDLNTSID